MRLVAQLPAVGTGVREGEVGPAQAGPTSLDTYAGTVDEIGSAECPRSRINLINTLTGQVVPGRCRASFCDYCGPVQAWWKSRIISDGGATGAPTRYAVLTNAPADWKVLRQKMRDLRRLLGRRGFAWEQAWTVETGEQTGMRHVNALQKGDFVPQELLQNVWGAIVHIQAIKTAAGGVAGYALKEAQRVAGYSTKNASQADKLQAHLDANGGRLVHLSRGYLGGETQAVVMERLLAERESEGSWVVVPKASR